ncbi:AraC family transcriptional regulator [Chthonobacter albigriseus]|uniref:AraC family transcriptional regulator n=1 Tax=Chthonobacter albigriseus TaxID=1683161 RepID=UPI0015EF002C|nr:AraC family transcriptional regulator [Chthonobacter albigriseus]
MEPLTAIITLLRPQVVRPKLIAAAGPWAVRYPRVDVAGYGLVLAGSCHLIPDGSPPVVLSAGDFVLMPPAPGFVMTSDPSVEPIDGDPDPSGRLTEVRHGGRDSAPDFEMLGGYFRFESANLSLLADLLPSLVHVRAGDPTAKRLSATIDLTTEEALSGRPGRDLILERLIEVMLIEALRHAGGKPDASGGPSLLRGLVDPNLSRALRCLHADLKRRWTVGDLAREAGLSRSAFSERFSAMVGLPPMEYVIQWRMAVARDALRKGDMQLEELALAIGYESASAFSTAFRKNVGRPPRSFAREMRLGAAEDEGPLPTVA